MDVNLDDQKSKRNTLNVVFETNYFDKKYKEKPLPLQVRGSGLVMLDY
jgi:hypothetical protein